MRKTIGFTHSHRESVPSPRVIAVSSAIYVGGAIAVGLLDKGFLLLAWLMTLFLAMAVYLTLDAHGRLFNAYTVFFAGIIGAAIAGHFLL